MKRATFNLLFILALLFGTVSVAGASQAVPGGIEGGGAASPRKAANGVYIVQLVEQPVVAYTGDIPGYKATKPKPNQKINQLDPDVVKYVGYLDSRHDAVLSAVGGSKLYDFRYTYNGFAAKLSLAQAIALKNTAGVLAVSADEMVSQDTSTTPAFLGLSAPGGLWDQLGGVGSAGEGIVIGIVDSGIWPEALSFSDRNGAGKLVYQQIPGWNAKCTPGENFNGSNCNQKLIGAQYYNAAWGGNAAIDAQRPWEFDSPRDYNGHGTHTASTAGGNNGVAATGAAAAFGSISGMAPRARISVYKALWSTQDGSTASGFNSDLVAAIDQAVADGVDVINYSISGTTTNFLDPVQVAFLFAADAGVFVAASAGNSGPTAGTVAHPSPWITTVAAGTHNRNGIGSVTLGNTAVYTGASVATPVGPAPLILSTAAGLSGADANQVRQCFSGTLDPAVVTGKIVVCERGGPPPANARVDKSLAVKNAGGVGMILVNVAVNSINADFHFVPTVHLNNVDGASVKAYAATAGATAKINGSIITTSDAAPFTASFSSRGPLAGANGDLLKPDVIAPGQDILAAVAPPGQAGLSFNLLSGTSMSSPHVAGVAALLAQLHPDWTPMMIKSALMTTGYDVLDTSISDATRIFRQGAGHIKPNNAANPGLVFQSDFNDWLAFLCGTTNAVNPASCTALVNAGYKLDPSDMNVASIAIGDMAGVQTVRRRVTNVGGSAATYTPAAPAGLSGITVSFAPASLVLNPGETKIVDITFTRTTASLNAYTGGQITWSDGSHSVRVPVVIQPVALAAPVQVSGNGGQINYSVKFGYTGSFTADPRGLVAAATTAGSIGDDPTDNFVKDGPGTISYTVSVPAGTTYARFSLFNSSVSPASDLDLYVYNGTTQVGASGGGTADEEVNLVNPPAANYTVYVHGFAVVGTANFTLYQWVLGSSSAGNMAVSAPGTATTGATGNIQLTFSGLAPATKYLGSVAYGGSPNMPNPTIVRVDTP